jgi:glycosyltransferase involved in cell wall biosynthesis
VPWKFDEKRKQNFLDRDKIVDYYLTYTESTKDLIQSISNKPVKLISHWVNTSVWNKVDKNESRKSLGIPEDRFLIGSFQRDTEGFDLKTPKLEKGPDIFIKKVIEIAQIKNNVHVILAGWRRQYVISELEKNNIDYTYFELPDIDILNKLYNALDLYIVSARCEGGPQAIFECGYLEIPILSTEVGQHHLLDKNCKFREEEKIDVNKIKLAYDSISKNKKNIDMLIDIKHINKYDEFLENIK